MLRDVPLLAAHEPEHSRFAEGESGVQTFSTRAGNGRDTFVAQDVGQRLVRGVFVLCLQQLCGAAVASAMKLICHGGSHDGREIEIPEADIGFERIVRLASYRPVSEAFSSSPVALESVATEIYRLVWDERDRRWFLILKK